MTLHPAPTIEPGHPPTWQLKTSSFRLPMANPLSSFKTNNKLAQILARAEAAAGGADDALMLNTNGEVVETTSANIFWVQQDTIYATPTGRGALPGITRAVVLELCQALGVPTAKKAIKPETLRKADSVFLTLSSCGVVPVNSLDGEPVNESPLVHQICQAYWDVVAKSGGCAAWWPALQPIPGQSRLAYGARTSVRITVAMSKRPGRPALTPVLCGR
jgi:branched-subunit amino acid aminotransferase/4-amino-4-deoxychorismate lyase